MRELLPLGLLIVAGLLLAGALYFLLRAVQTRRLAGRAAYGFAQVENQKAVRVDLLRAALLVFLGLLLGTTALLGRPAADADAADGNPTPMLTQTPTVAGDEADPPPTIAAATSTTLPPTATPTSPLPTLTPSPTPSQTPTPSATPLPSALVASPNGLYLRDVPGGTAELELIPDGARLTLLGETEEADGLSWVRVRTELGNVGWVAADFIDDTAP